MTEKPGYLFIFLQNILWLLVLSFLVFCWLLMGKNVYPGMTNLELPIGVSIPSGKFLVLFILTWIAMPVLVSVMPKRWIPCFQITVIFLVSIGARLTFFNLAISDDASKNMLLGELLINGTNPYIVSIDLDHQSISSEPDLSLFSRPPGILCLAGLISKHNYGTGAWRIVVFFTDLFILGILIIILKQNLLPIRNALLYGIHPLILTSFSGHGHIDVFLTAAVLLSILAYQQKKWIGMFILLGLSIQISCISFLLIPFFIRKTNWKHAWITLLIGLGPSLSFFFSDGFGVFDKLVHFSSNSSFNASIHRIFVILTGDVQKANILCISIFFLIWIFFLIRLHPDRQKGIPVTITTICILILSILIIMSPTVHPWSICIIIPLISIRSFASGKLLSLTIAFAYLADGYKHTTGIQYLPPVAQILIWIPFILIFIFEANRILNGYRKILKKSSSKSISVIIPIYNGQRYIRKTILHAIDESLEVIVIDGGSIDNSIEYARDAGATVILHDLPIHSGGGRGGQILAGLKKASGDIAVILTSDTQLLPGQLVRIKDFMALNDEYSGGAIGSQFDRPSLKSEILASANAFRAGFIGLAFSDQVQFFRREWVIASGIFPAIPLMEDVELSIRLKLLGPTMFLWDSARISIRRWKRYSWARTMMLIRLTTAWIIHRSFGTPDAVAFYKTYYKK
ncbi:glycosyltransferase [bacterium]|nr:glycosyltransferase [bacterium]